MMKATAKENANRTAKANRRYKRDWCVLYAEIIACESLRKNLFELGEEELRDEVKNKNTFVAFMQSMNKGFVQYNFYRELTNLFDKIMERRADTFAHLDQSDTSAMSAALENEGFTSMAETTKLLQTPEEIEAIAAEAEAKRQQKITRRKIATRQFQKIQAAKDEEASTTHEEAPTVPTSTKKRGRPKKETKLVVPGSDAQEDLIATLLRDAQENDSSSEEEDGEDIEEIEGVEETKGGEDIEEIEGVEDIEDIEEIEGVEETKGGEDIEESHLSLHDENVMLRTRVKQLEEFIMEHGLQAPLPVPLMALEEAETVVLADSTFDNLEGDAVVAPSSDNHEDESDDENEVVVFEHEGIKYYKDAEDQLYSFGDIENAELIGWWNAETKTIEEFDDDEDEEEE